MNVIERAGDGERHPKILSCGKQLFSKIVQELLDKELGNSPDEVLNSRDLIVKKLDKNGITNYESSKFSTKITPIGSPEEILSWMEQLHDLSSKGCPKTADEMLKMLEKKDDMVGN